MFYDNLKRICDERGIKITPLVEECNGSRGSISKWRNGAYPNSDIVIKLAMRLGVSTDSLLLENENSSTTERSLSKDEYEFIHLFNQLEKDDKYRVIGRMEAIVDSYPPEVKESIS